MSAPITPAAATATTAPTLAELIAAQQASAFLACDLHFTGEQLLRFRQLYARKLAELSMLFDLFEEPALDIILQTIDGRRLALRLPLAQSGAVYTALRDTLTDNIGKLEREILEFLSEEKEAAEAEERRPAKEDFAAVRRAVLALCLPTLQSSTE